LTLYSADSNVKLRTGSPKTARNEEVCGHQKSYRRQIFQINFGAVMRLSDSSCAAISQFFDAALDGATADRQIPDRIFVHFLPVCGRIASPIIVCIDLDAVFTSVRGLGVLYNALNVP